MTDRKRVVGRKYDAPPEKGIPGFILSGALDSSMDYGLLIATAAA